jgi:hypothetical protein
MHTLALPPTAGIEWPTMDPELRRRMDEWAAEMHRDLRAIIEQIAANNRRIEQLRSDLHRDRSLVPSCPPWYLEA